MSRAVMAEGPSTILVLFTTEYREGGAAFRRAAHTLGREKTAAFPQHRVVVQAVERKAAFVEALEAVGREGSQLAELHFIGHSGMYGIMFGTQAWPEQLSPFEWRSLRIAFAPDARVFFHACRTARWFAPFIARTFGVRTSGYFWYTTVSRRKDRFSFERGGADAYVISVPGKKSHGATGTLRKHLLRANAYPMTEFLPGAAQVDTTYDAVAHLYDETFDDISVRGDELRWLRAALASEPKGRLLDIGCGTGSFLRATRDLVSTADGVDLSAGMIDHARRRVGNDTGLRFTQIDGPMLPFPDASFDVVTSVLSFRYLDWDPIIREVLRVLRPGGRLLVVDMVAAPPSLRELPRVAVDKVRQQVSQVTQPRYRQALQRMVSDPAWKKMLEHNPIRAEHELRWYLGSRFPGGTLEVINYGLHSRVLAFRSPPLYAKSVEALSYP